METRTREKNKTIKREEYLAMTKEKRYYYRRYRPDLLKEIDKEDLLKRKSCKETKRHKILESQKQNRRYREKALENQISKQDIQELITTIIKQERERETEETKKLYTDNMSKVIEINKQIQEIIKINIQLINGYSNVSDELKRQNKEIEDTQIKMSQMLINIENNTKAEIENIKSQLNRIEANKRDGKTKNNNKGLIEKVKTKFRNSIDKD